MIKSWVRVVINTFAFLLVVTAYCCQAQTTTDNISCLGNGILAVYESNADIIQVFGPSYSSSSIMEMKLDSNISVVSEREKGTAIWKHNLFVDNNKIGEITDYVVDGVPGLIRQVKNKETLRFTIQKPKENSWIKNEANFSRRSISGAALSKTPAGTFVYSTYPAPQETYHQIITKGKALLVSSNDVWEISAEKGESTIIIVGGPSYPECITNTRSVLRKSPGEWLNQTRKWWLDFTFRRTNFAEKLPANVPERRKLLQTIDDVAVLIKTQQSAEGAVLAGHNYHLGYIRDQYGVSRGLLKMGYYPEAKAILEFYWNIWSRKGVLHNAQGIRMDAFHIHENDEVEQTGYLIMQAFDYLKKTKDTAFFKQIFPMLEWAWNSQKKHLIKYMLPFNGDETYVAGGILPRTSLLDGSAESTLLFITSGDLFLQWIEKYKYWSLEKIKEATLMLEEVKGHYNENFIESGKLMTNNPKRMEGEKYPEFRHGVCESLIAPCEVFGWTQRTGNNRYLCPLCYGVKILPKAEAKKYFLQSVSLIPFYINATILPDEQVKLQVQEIGKLYKQTGKFPSRPDGHSTVGYDYGLFLYSLSKLKDPLKDEIYLKMLDVLDKTGAWVEYYEDNKPRGTRYRPWESAINIEAAIVFAETYNEE